MGKMAGPFGVRQLAAVLYLSSLVTFGYGNYVIMMPKTWEQGGQSQVCVVVDNADSPAGEIVLAASQERLRRGRYSSLGKPDYDYEEESKIDYVTPTTFSIPSGKTRTCQMVQVNEYQDYGGYTDLIIVGDVSGLNVNLSAHVQFTRQIHNTVIQTNKHLYEPGQLVKFRILTYDGPIMKVSTLNYPEVWVTSPSRTRIAQWLQVDNSAGLVHLEMQLADEPEEGSYAIHVSSQGPGGRKFTETTSFKVQEYVLPRFEVTIQEPKYVLARDNGFSFKVCAKYTFGKPVNGDLSVLIDNKGQRKCNTVITRNVTLSGCTEIEVSNLEIRTVDCSIHSVHISALVVEAGTGVDLAASKYIPISRNAVSFKTLHNDRFMKYNLPYALKVKAERPDGSPAAGVDVELCYDGRCNDVTTPSDGILQIHVMNFDSRRVVMKSTHTPADMYAASLTASIERYFSPSNSSLMIFAPDGDLECIPGQSTQINLPVLFATPDMDQANIFVQVMSRDKIQSWLHNTYQLDAGDFPYKDELFSGRPHPVSGPGKTGVINIPLDLPVTIAPSAWVLVWYIREDGEVVSDSREVTMKKCLPNKVDLRWSTDQAGPAESATVSIASEPSSICSLGVVDRSVELLNPESNTLTLDSFFSGITTYHSRWRHRSQINDYRYCQEKHSEESGWSYFTDYVDAKKMFDDSGLFVFSDLHLETRPCEKQAYERRSYSSSSSRVQGRPGMSSMDAPVMYSPMSASSDNMEYDMTMPEVSIVSEEDTSTNPRSNFPETWLWDLVVVPPSGQSNLEVKMPDTITEWAGKAVCVHPIKGIGLSERETITTFTPFFLDMTLPPSIKRGEILPVKISVFNYLDETLPVTVTLEESIEYEIHGGASESMCIDSHDMKVHSIKIQPSIIGDVNITVSAFVDHSHSCGAKATKAHKRDAMIKSVLVEAEGFPREKTWTKYICSDELTDGSDAMETWEVSAPSAIVEGSDRGWVMVVGDLLALSVDNLGHLIRMPYGCGEQNMLNFAPNIFILQYLDATNQNAPEAKQKLLRYMQTGYQRQLLYLRHDGSFSTFGNADDSGSTLLTAFVLKAFTQAADYILIDHKTINSTMKWLKKQQSEEGCFKSVGTVFNKAMRGGVTRGNTSVSLTAYVMIALLESKQESMTPVVFKAASCLQSDSSDNPYVIALKTYAFALSQNSDTALLIERLLSLSTTTGTETHWELSHSSWRSRSLEVETAGYAILAMLQWDAQVYEQQIRRIVKWMSNERNGQGGFISTQDTVVALQAMASFERHLDRGNLDAEISVTTTDLAHKFTVKEDNKLLRQQVSLPSLPTTVHLDLAGEGCVLVQSVLRYNIPEPEPSDAFGITVSTMSVRDKTCVTKKISFCASYLLPDGKSNMAVIEINLVSGYIPEKQDLKDMVADRKNQFKRYEVDGSKVSLYADELTGVKLCGNIRVIREVTVDNVKPGSVVVYDYYQPEFSLSKSYRLPPQDDCPYAW